jgi:hypothetical protein
MLIEVDVCNDDFFYLMCILNLILRRAEIRVCFGIFWLRSRSCLMKFSNRVSFVANFTKKSPQTKLETKTRWNKTEMKRGICEVMEI